MYIRTFPLPRGQVFKTFQYTQDTEVYGWREFEISQRIVHGSGGWFGTSIPEQAHAAVRSKLVGVDKPS